MGVGKTAACRALQKMAERSVFLDGDWCWDANPFTVTCETKTMVIDNICHLLDNFLRCTEYENVIFCWVMHQQEIIETILSRLHLTGCRVISVSLVCSVEELLRRIEKDIDAGMRSEDVISRSLERMPMYDKLSTIKLETTNMSPEEAARALLKMGK